MQAKERFEGEFASLKELHMLSALRYRCFIVRVPTPMALLDHPDDDGKGALLVTQFLTMNGKLDLKEFGDKLAK